MPPHSPSYSLFYFYLHLTLSFNLSLPRTFSNISHCLFFFFLPFFAIVSTSLYVPFYFFFFFFSPSLFLTFSLLSLCWKLLYFSRLASDREKSFFSNSNDDYDGDGNDNDGNDDDNGNDGSKDFRRRSQKRVIVE